MQSYDPNRGNYLITSNFYSPNQRFEDALHLIQSILTRHNVDYDTFHKVFFDQLSRHGEFRSVKRLHQKASKWNTTSLDSDTAWKISYYLSDPVEQVKYYRKLFHKLHNIYNLSEFIALAIADNELNGMIVPELDGILGWLCNNPSQLKTLHSDADPDRIFREESASAESAFEPVQKKSKPERNEQPSHVHVYSIFH